MVAEAKSNSSVDIKITPGNLNSYTVQFIGHNVSTINAFQSQQSVFTQQNLEANAKYTVEVSVDGYIDGYTSVVTWPGGRSTFS